jgi:purine nucleosidase
MRVMIKRFLFALILILINLNISGQRKVIIDADTTNEVDDIVAIARALISDKIEVVGLTAAQWANEDSWMIKTAQESWELNNLILELLDREKTSLIISKCKPITD